MRPTSSAAKALAAARIVARPRTRITLFIFNPLLGSVECRPSLPGERGTLSRQAHELKRVFTFFHVLGDAPPRISPPRCRDPGPAPAPHRGISPASDHRAAALGAGARRSRAPRAGWP